MKTSISLDVTLAQRLGFVFHRIYSEYPLSVDERHYFDHQNTGKRYEPNSRFDKGSMLIDEL
ncbi:MAG: hypothetical protein K9H64_02205 [Bacteroidales bacterium]|nr:hypothetical protein [Bacteroidales bacterium]MCF8454640.1 hypothetical protein [Bacteroidales bacterium]